MIETKQDLGQTIVLEKLKGSRSDNCVIETKRDLGQTIVIETKRDLGQTIV